MLDPARHNYHILGRSPYWWRQREIARSVAAHPITLVPTGNAIGKTYLAAGLILWFLYEHPGCLVISTAPTQTQLEEVLWKEIRRAHEQSYCRLPGDIRKSPLKIEIAPGWQALGYSTTKTERLSGHHAENLLAVIDEASGVEPEIIEAIDSLNPSRLLMIGNPLRPDGPFYDRCQSAPRNRLANVIQIASTESPDATLERSTRGLADANWLEKARNDYGEGSLWWTTHVLGLFPDSGVDTVLPKSWLDRAASVPLVRRGCTRTAIDLAEGRDGDRSVVLTRDDGGLLQVDHSPRWNFEATAGVAARHAQKWEVEHHRITFDVAGIGADFNNRLQTLGIVGAQPYRGGGGGGKKHGNLRSQAAWSLRQRLDPERLVPAPSGPMVPQSPFSIRPEFMAPMRDELQGLRYTLDPTGRVCLEIKEDFVKRLKRSPDLADAMIQSFAFNN